MVPKKKITKDVERPAALRNVSSSVCDDVTILEYIRSVKNHIPVLG